MISSPLTSTPSQCCSTRFARSQALRGRGCQLADVALEGEPVDDHEQDEWSDAGYLQQDVKGHGHQVNRISRPSSHPQS